MGPLGIAEVSDIITGAVGFLTILGLAVKVGQYRERLRSKAETVETNDKVVTELDRSMKDIRTDLRGAEDRLDEVEADLERVVRNQYRAQRVTHDLLLDEDTCGHDFCPYCNDGALTPAVDISDYGNGGEGRS